MHGIAEEGRVAVRNIRRDVMHDLRELKSEGEVGADDEHRAEAELQKLTDARVGEIDDAAGGQGRRDPRGLSRRRRWRALRGDHHGRERALGAASAGCRVLAGPPGRAPTR